MSIDDYNAQAALQGAELLEHLNKFLGTVRSVIRTPSVLPHEVAIFYEKDNAVACFANALRETIKYMRARREGALPDGSREETLSTLWADAGNSVRRLDPELANRCMMKSLAWADPQVWERAKTRGIKIGVEEMESSLSTLLSKERAMESNQNVPTWFPIAGVGFAVLAVCFLMYLILAGQDIPYQRQNLINLFMALSVAASGAFLGGDAVAKGKIPFFRDSPITFSAVGGVGIFVVVYLILHYTM